MTRTTIMTGVNILVLVLVVLFSGLGHTMAQTIQDVLVTNTGANPVPIQSALKPFQKQLSLNLSNNQTYASVQFVTPATQCLVLEDVSFAFNGGDPLTVADLDLVTTAGGVIGRSYLPPPVAPAKVFIQQVTLYADPGSTVYVQLNLASNPSGYTELFTVTLSGSLHPCVTGGPTVRGVASFSAHTRGTHTTFASRMGVPSGVLGFELYAGSHRLTNHMIPTHRSRDYKYVAGHTNRRPFALHVLLAGGGELTLLPTRA